MDIKNYMVMTAEWIPQGFQDPDTLMMSYSAPVTISCYIYGKRKYIRGTDGGTLVSTQTYVTQAEVGPGDQINGQVVKEVNLTADFDGSVLLRECVCW